MLKIVNAPNSILTSTTKPIAIIDDKIKKIIKDMIKVLNAQNDPPGVGLAANQVGLDLSIFIIKPTINSEIETFINPRILELVTRNPQPTTTNKKKSSQLEGCLSIPKIWGPVKRAIKVLLEYQDTEGKKHTEWFSGFKAIIIQHEVDHLNGILFTQRSLEQKGQLYEEKGGELKKIEP